MIQAQERVRTHARAGIKRHLLKEGRLTLDLKDSHWYRKDSTFPVEGRSRTKLLSLKKNEIMPFVATWVDPEIIILSEVSQIEKETYCITSLICEI